MVVVFGNSSSGSRSSTKQTRLSASSISLIPRVPSSSAATESSGIVGEGRGKMAMFLGLACRKVGNQLCILERLERLVYSEGEECGWTMFKFSMQPN